MCHNGNAYIQRVSCSCEPDAALRQRYSGSWSCEIRPICASYCPRETKIENERHPFSMAAVQEDADGSSLVLALLAGSLLISEVQEAGAIFCPIIF